MVSGIIYDRFKNFLKVLDSLKSQFVMRDEEINTVACGLLCQTNVLFVGEPGTAKSLLVSKFAEHLGIMHGEGFFQYLLTKYTEPSELFGTVDIVKLREGKYEVITKNKLPEANVVFLDEVFNAGSAILNSLLMIINEKKLIIGDVFRDVSNLLVIFGATNSISLDPSIRAFVDRFPIRVFVNNVGNTRETLTELLKKELRIELDSHGKKADPSKNNTIFDRNDFISFSQEINKHIVESLVPDNSRISRTILMALEIIGDLRLRGIFISDRNVKHLLKFMYAHAMIRTRNLEPSEILFDDIKFVLTKVGITEDEKQEIEDVILDETSMGI